MKCVFPKAVKLWQKVLCGTVGVTAIGGGLYAFGYAISQIPPPVYVPKSYTELELERQNATSSKIVGYLDRNERIISMITLPLCVGASLFCARMTLKYPFWFWPVVKDEFYMFYNAIRGTECCNIVRKTARFSIMGPISVAVFSASIVVYPMASALFGWTAYEIGESLKTKD